MPISPPAPVLTSVHGDDDVVAVVDSLRRLVHALHSASRDTERRLGVTGAQLFVLAQLRATPSLSINALAGRTMTHQSTVSVVVRRLVQRKLVKKVRAADDARRVELTLTPAGARLIARAPEAIQVRLVNAIGSVPPAECHQLARTLKLLVKQVGADQTSVPMFFELGGKQSS